MRPGRARWAVLVGGVLVLVLLGVLAVRSTLGADEPACAEAADAPGGRWCRIYRQDFAAPAALGSFGNEPADDWFLRPDHPYAGSLRSYPDGWGTTKNFSLNYASRTTDVVTEAAGAQGVLRLHGHSAEVAGRTESLGGSFYPVIDPRASGARQVSQTYGRYTVRFRTSGGFPAGSTATERATAANPRYGTAFLLWPASDVWAEGEIDYPEMTWGAPVAGYVHTIGRPEVNSGEVRTSTSTQDRWNTATLEWTPGLLVFGLNGAEVGRVTTDVPSTPFRWGLQSGGTLGTPAADVSGYLYVDDITVDAYAAADVDG